MSPNKVRWIPRTPGGGPPREFVGRPRMPGGGEAHYPYSTLEQHMRIQRIYHEAAASGNPMRVPGYFVDTQPAGQRAGQRRVRWIPDTLYTAGLTRAQLRERRQSSLAVAGQSDDDDVLGSSEELGGSDDSSGDDDGPTADDVRRAV